MSSWADIFNFSDQLSSEERLIQDTTKEYCQKSLMPRILDANRNESFDKEIYNFIQVCPKEMLDKLENPISTKKIVGIAS